MRHCIDCGASTSNAEHQRCMSCEYARRREGREDRFWAKVDRSGGGAACWPWQASRTPSGYGRFGDRATQGGWRVAHRVAYQLVVGPIPEDMELDHTCHNRDVSCPGGSECHHRRCVNPAHLDPVTTRVNLLRSPFGAGALSRRTHCGQGHAYTPENTYLRQKRAGFARACRRCHADREWMRRYGPSNEVAA